MAVGSQLEPRPAVGFILFTKVERKNIFGRGQILGGDWVV